MSSDAILADASTRFAFRCGESLLASHAVSDWEARNRSASVVEVKGPVLDEGAPLPVSIAIDFRAGRVLDHSCPCASHANGKGLCKHCVALGLSYLAYFDANARKKPAAASPAAPAAPKAAAPSSPARPEPPAAPSRPAAVQTAPAAQSPASGTSAAPARPAAKPLGDDSELIRKLKEQTRELLAQYKSEDSRPAAPSRPAAIQEPQTSPQVGKLVWAYAQRQVDQADQADEGAASEGAPGATELHDLFPTLASAGRVAGSTGARTDACAWELKLRVGTDQPMYMVRQVDDLVRAWEEGQVRSYGRNLSFAHTRGAFTDRANRLLALAARVLHTQEAARSTVHVAPGAALPTSNPKSLPLSDADAAELLDIMCGSRIQFEPRVVSGSSRARDLAVIEGDPELQVGIVRGERGGFDLELPTGADCVLAKDRMFLFVDGYVWRCSDTFRQRMGTFCRAVLPASAPLHLREADMPGFCSAVLPVIKDAVHVDVPADLEVLLPPPAAFQFSIGTVRGYVTCDVRVAYGSDVVGLFDEVKPGKPLRDPVGERAVRRLVRTYFGSCLPAVGWQRSAHGEAPAPQPWLAGSAPSGKPCFESGDTEALYRLITEGLPAFRETGEVFVSEDLRGVSVRQAPRVRIEASIKSGLLDIAIDSSDLSPHDLLAYLDSFERKQRFVRLADGDILRLDDGGVRAVAELAAGLGVSPRALVEKTEDIPMNRALFVDAMLKSSDGVRFDRDESFRSVIRDFDSIGDNDFVEPQSLRDVLRPYQRAGFKWISTLAKLGFGGILADDMGLGKTLQVIAFLLAQREAGSSDPSLVVCPASLVYNWTAELQRFAPQLSVAAVVGHKDQRAALIQTARGYDLLVTSYELLKRDVDLYERQTFHCQVLDEAQYIKNHATQAARCVKRVRSTIRLALTGTPIENRLSELWSIFDYLMPGLLGSYEAFHRRFEVPIAAGEQAAARRLQCMVGPFVLRRMKADVLKDLPEKTESVVYASMSGEQEKLYQATASQLAMTLAHQLPADFARDRIAVLAELTRLRQICCDPHLVYDNFEGESAKLETCLELVANAVDGGHKVLLFSQFTSMLKIIAGRLDAMGCAHHELTGSTPKEERARLVASFATDDVPVFLISLKAGGVGLNLTAADIVIHYDPWWNLAAQNQATDRAHRIGQTNAVTVMRLIAKDTVEEKIVKLQESKRDLAESIIGGEAVSSTSLTKEDILALLEP